MEKEIVIYQAENGAIELRNDFSDETVWASQKQIAQIFDIDQSVVSRHIKNIFSDQEISEKSNMQKMHIAFSDKPVGFYSLDVILSVGYRVNSKVAIDFRKWATQTLKNHIMKGFTINPSRIEKNYSEFLKAVENVKEVIPHNSLLKKNDILELITLFADTWFSLDAYDKSELPEVGDEKEQADFTAEDLARDLKKLKENLMQKKEATDLFGQEKDQGNLAGIVGNIFQSFGGESLYPSREEKAAHLLYFIVKNHPFTDGNKRSGAFAFVWFLQRYNLLNTQKFSPQALTALTLLVAESNPKNKEQIVGLILLLLQKKT